MAAFEYSALNQHGRRVRGILEADSLRQARQQLRKQELAPLTVTAAGQGRSGGHRPYWLQHRLSGRELTLITRQLATLISASLPVEEALLAVSRQTEKPRIRTLMMGVRGKLLEGFSLVAALGDYPRAFPPMYRATVAAGEATGHLDSVLLRLAEHNEDRQLSKQKVLQALVYPVLLLVMSVLILSGLLAYVVPDIIRVFADTDQPLPALTLGLITISDLVQRWGLLLLVLVALLFLLFRQAMQNPGFRFFCHRLQLQLPLVGGLSRGVNTARFASTLAILTSSGVPLVDALRISGQVLANSFLQGKVAEATDLVSEGSSFYQALNQGGCFPPLMLYMIASGESSGELDQMLVRTATYMQEEADTLIGILLSLTGPLLLLTMGGLIFIIVLAILLPIMSWNQLVL